MSKGTKMDLNTFHKYVAEKKAKNTTPGKRSGESLSDRLKNKFNKDDVPTTRFKGASTLVRRQAEYRETGADFPVLAEVHSLPGLGDWSKGVDTILAAKDLPDPYIAEQAKKNSRINADRVAKRRTYQEEDDEYEYDGYDTPLEYSDSDEGDTSAAPVPVPVVRKTETVTQYEDNLADDIDWKEI